MAEYSRSYRYDKGLTIDHVPTSNLQLILPLNLSKNRKNAPHFFAQSYADDPFGNRFH